MIIKIGYTAAIVLLVAIYAKQLKAQKQKKRSKNIKVIDRINL